MRWIRSDTSWIWLGCALPLVGWILIISIAVWFRPTTDFTLPPLQLDSTNPFLGDWRVIASCGTPPLPAMVRFTLAGDWVSLSDPTLHGTYHSVDADHVELVIGTSTIRYTLRIHPHALYLWDGQAYQKLVRDTIQFGGCGSQ